MIWKDWFKLILNYFMEGWTNVFTEGVNNKIKLIKRRTFGFTNFDYFRLGILVEYASRHLHRRVILD